MNHRKVEVYREDGWVETPFEALQVGDIFRLWEPVIEQDEKLGEVIAWRCKSPPEQRDGIYGCMTEPAIAAKEAAEPSEPPAEEPPIGPYNNRFG